MELFPIKELRERLPRSPSLASIWRWTRYGIMLGKNQRIRLQTVRIGGRLFTSAQWVHEFMSQLAQSDNERFGSQNQ